MPLPPDLKTLPVVQEYIDLLVDQSARGKDFTPILERLGDEFLTVSQAMYDSSGGTNKSGRWRRLANSTIRQKGHSRILDRTGNLKRSLTRKGGDHIRLISRTSIEVGSRNPLLRLHQDAKGRRRRKLVDPTDAQIDAYGDLIADWYATGEVPP